ncbi:hypothetical protein [Mastigocoleus testarum]|nr:hypothetical protein [Mastigocoleus testarum]
MTHLFRTLINHPGEDKFHLGEDKFTKNDDLSNVPEVKTSLVA